MTDQVTQTARPSKFQLNMRRLFAQSHIWIYHASGGHIGHRLGPVTTMLLTTTGRKTGLPRITPITYFRDGDNYVLVASNYGSVSDPIWLLNLRAHSEATVQVGPRTMRVQTHVANAEEKQRLWPMAVHYQKMYADYQRKTPRDIPLVVLQPIS